MKISFRVYPNKVDRAMGVLGDVSIISTGEAVGHQMMVTPLTLGRTISILDGQTVPAYITHGGASFDRLLDEIGTFSGFYISGERLLAREFTAFPSFMKDDAPRFNRLFDLAAAAPGSFGISMVFEATLAWETSGGLLLHGDSRPVDAVHTYQTVIPTLIHSFDFVDAPAANAAGLFSSNIDKAQLSRENMQTLSDAIEVAVQQAANVVLNAEPPVCPEVTAIADALPTVDSLSAELLVANKEVEALTARGVVLAGRIFELEKLGMHSVAPVVQKIEAVLSNKDMISKKIGEYLLTRPADSRSTAVLAIAKTNPELFERN